MRSRSCSSGGGNAAIALGEHDPGDPRGEGLEHADFLALDAALDRLKDYNERSAEIVMHRYFAGRTIEETAEFLGTSIGPVKAG